MAIFSSTENDYVAVLRACSWHANRMECIEEELSWYNSAWAVSNGLTEQEDHAKRVLTKYRNVFGGKADD